MSGVALCCRGLAEAKAGLLRQAVDAYSHGQRPLELALACEDAGDAFARQGSAETAVPFLGQALAAYERLGAIRDLARAQAALRALGVRHGRRGARKRPRYGWQSLTSPTGVPRVFRTAELVLFHVASWRFRYSS
jgi:hypothetical protein